VCGGLRVGALFTDAIFAEVSDANRQAIDRSRLYKLPNGRTRHVLGSHVEFGD